jgi:tryptophanyl-tRNA synthetase
MARRDVLPPITQVTLSSSEPLIHHASVPSLPDTHPVLYPVRIASGIQPAPHVHLGHYFGVIENQLALQHQYPGQSFYFLGDSISLTRRFPPNELRSFTLELVASWLALGMDYRKTCIFRQSDVPEIWEIAWYLSRFASETSVRQLESTKPSSSEMFDQISKPLIMAATYLTFRSTLVPVGPSGIRHVELASQLAGMFNRSWQVNLFPIPRPNCQGKKPILGGDLKPMSWRFANTIGLFENDTTRMFEQIASLQPSRALSPEECPLFQLYSRIGDQTSIQRLRQGYLSGTTKSDDAWKMFAVAMFKKFASFRGLYNKYRTRPDDLLGLLHDGARVARQHATRTLQSVREIIGF